LPFAYPFAQFIFLIPVIFSIQGCAIIKYCFVKTKKGNFYVALFDINEFIN